jgi:hypothetical protein
MRLATILALWCALGAAPAGAASIGLYSTTDCTSCNLTIPLGQPGTVYICFTGASSTPAFSQFGLYGAEFGVVGLPATWAAQVTRSPFAGAVVGDPFNGGTDIGFPEAQVGDCILLFTVQVFAGSVDEVILQVTRREPPTNPNFDCPFGIPGPPPVFGGIRCVGGGAMFINSNRQCQVSTQPTAWSQVKKLYD